MNIINRLAVSFLLSLLLVATVKADVESDMTSKLPFETVIKNGLTSHLPMGVILVKIFSMTPKDQGIAVVSAAVNLSPNDVATIVKVAIRAGLDPEEVVTEAVALAPLDRKIISQAAIASGADAMDVTLASAAGVARSGVTLASTGALGALPVSVPAFTGGNVAPITPPTRIGGAPVKENQNSVSPS